MKTALLLILTGSLLCCSCNTNHSARPAFKAFDFSYDDVFATCFSIKFTQGDTVYVVQHFPKYREGGLKVKQVYVGTLRHEDRIRLDTLIHNTNFFSIDDSYTEMIQDGLEYQFYIQNDTAAKMVRVHSHHAPPALDTLANWIAEVKARMRLVEVDTAVTFGSLKQFLPPEVAPPSVEFIPPANGVKHKAK